MMRSGSFLSTVESIKLLQYFFSSLDINHYYDLRRWKFLSCCAVTCKYLVSLFSVRNFKHCHIVNLQNCYELRL